MSTRSPLPASWVEQIFRKLTVVYGRDFLSRYEGVSMPDVMADWGYELGGFQANSDAIKHALEHLPPNKAPTVLEFRDICKQAPVKTQIGLPPPKMSDEERRQATETVKRLRIKVGASAGPREWAHALQRRDEAGDRLTPTQRMLYREALRSDPDVQLTGSFEQVPVETLPPAMRPDWFDADVAEAA